MRPSTGAWLGLAGYVVAADAFLIWRRQKDHQCVTMSRAFGDAISHPFKRIPVISIWVYLTLHLFGEFLPERFGQYDPLSRIAGVLDKSVWDDAEWHV